MFVNKPFLFPEIRFHICQSEILCLIEYLRLLHIPYLSIRVKPVQNGQSQKDLKLVFKTNYRLMHVKSIAECSKGSKRSILKYFRPSLSYHLSLTSLFCRFLSGHFTQVQLYVMCVSSDIMNTNEM